MNHAQIAKDSRIKCLELVYKAQTSHIGSLFSCADIMAVLFERIDLEKDKFVLSAGWKACMLYYHLWRKGRITLEQLNSYCQDGSPFIGLAEPVIPEIIIAGGSMGLGLPGAVGLAMAKKLKGEEGKVYCLMSDGELQIGTFWESVLIANHHKLDNLIVVVDKNGRQAMGKTDEILDVSSFFPMSEINGHDYTEIESSLDNDNLIFAKTTKGKGVSFMENNNLYHYKQLSDDEYQRALIELNG